MHKEKMIRIALIASRMILGLVFVFSGFVKGVDPMGSAFKFSDYFIAFGLEFLEPVIIPLALTHAAAEFLIGISLLFAFRYRLGAWLVAFFMWFFTILTFVIALTNPVTDCGCFGDAIVLTNWQTFAKNLILLPFVFIVLGFRKHQAEPDSDMYAWGGLLAFAVLFLSMEFNALRHLPMLDFRPYSIGTYIPDKISVPEGMPLDEYKTVLYYEKDGETSEFTEENFPWQDTTWKYVDSEHILVRRGYEPPIHDFTIMDEFGIDHVPSILQEEGYSFLLVCTLMEKADREALLRADELASWCQVNGHSFYCLSASIPADVDETVEELDLGFETYTTDEIALKTIVRSNPGLLLLKEGTIIGKWHYNDFPSPEELEGGIVPHTMTQYRRLMEKWNLGIFISLFLVLSAGLMYLPVYKRKNGR